MPRLPGYESQTSPLGGSGPAPVASPGAFGAGLGAAVGRAGKALEQREDQRARTWALRAMAQFRLVQTAAFDQVIEQTPLDAPDVTPGVLDAFDQAADQLTGSAPSSRARELVGNSLAEFRATYGRQALAFDAQRGFTSRENAAGEAIRAGQETLMRDPSLLAQVQRETRAGIEALALPGDTKSELLRKADQQFNATVVWGEIKADPDAAVAKLASGDLPTMEPNERLDWLDKALTESRRQRAERLAEQNRVDRLAAAAQEQAEEETFKEGSRLMAEGQLTAIWVEAHRDSLSGEKYAGFYKALREGTAGLDPETYVSLRLAAGRGEDVRPQAERERLAGRIDNEQFDRIVAEVESHGTPRPDLYKQGRDYISQALQPDPLQPDDGRRGRLADALDMWLAWAREHPGASVSEGKQEYRELVNRALIVERQATATLGIAPKFLVGDRTAPDLAATAEATEQAYRAGRLTDDEYAEEKRLIGDMAEAMRRMNEAAAASAEHRR